MHGGPGFFCFSGYVKPVVAMAFRLERVTAVSVDFVCQQGVGQALVKNNKLHTYALYE